MRRSASRPGAHALDAIGGATLALLMIAIHNAGDSVTHLVARGPQP